MALQWDDAYSVGVKEIDDQHKKLFEFIDRLEHHLEKGVTEKDVKADLDFLGMYIKSHFCYEEICMWRNKCPVADKNKKEHAKLEEAYAGFQERFQREGVSEDLLRKLHATAESWIINHIMKVDMHLKSCVNKTA
ncbi:MAG: hemerythrin family protein [Mariprofundaceae bacterium]|nr:hemerythrin family protein [Mariprofundaceae bacterium]